MAITDTTYHTLVDLEAIIFIMWLPLYVITLVKHIPVGCVPPAAVAVSPAMHAPHHAHPPCAHAPLSCTPLLPCITCHHAHAHPLTMLKCHAHTPYHACIACPPCHAPPPRTESQTPVKTCLRAVKIPRLYNSSIASSPIWNTGIQGFGGKSGCPVVLVEQFKVMLAVYWNS